MKSMCYQMSNIIVDDEVDVDLLRFRFVKKLLDEKIPFAIDFSMKDRMNLLTSFEFENSRS